MLHDENTRTWTVTLWVSAPEHYEAPDVKRELQSGIRRVAGLDWLAVYTPKEDARMAEVRK